MHQDIPPYEVELYSHNFLHVSYVCASFFFILQPKRRILKPNEFVVPTDKKRLALRWEIRHSLAQT